MKDRIKALRKFKNMKQADFAKELNLATNYISLIESGKNPVSDKLIHNIVVVFGVNETWLRDGAGEMFTQVTRESEIASITAALIKEDDPKRLALQKLFVDMSEENLECLYQTARKWLEEVDKQKTAQE